MVVLDIKNYKNERIGSLLVDFDERINDYDIITIDGNISVNELSFDDIYETNQRKIEIIDVERKEKTPYLSLNYESGLSPAEQEVCAYKKLKEYYLREEYYECFVLIWNYFGHINYGRDLYYEKTHGEIVGILIQNLLVSIQNQDDHLIDFIDRQISKIESWLINK